jgi:hypothetical protein
VLKFLTSQRRPVPKEGLEPSHPKAQDPKSCVSTSSTTPARDPAMKFTDEGPA